jgi:hypothetical protein
VEGAAAEAEEEDAADGTMMKTMMNVTSGGSKS